MSSKLTLTFNFYRDSDFLSPLQSEFMPKDSTVNQLASLYHSICRALDEGKEFQAVHVYFVIFQKLLIEFGTKVFSLNFVRVASVVDCWHG